jgi:hypothetical protein
VIEIAGVDRRQLPRGTRVSLVLRKQEQRRNENRPNRIAGELLKSRPKENGDRFRDRR